MSSRFLILGPFLLVSGAFQLSCQLHATGPSDFRHKAPQMLESRLLKTPHENCARFRLAPLTPHSEMAPKSFGLSLMLFASYILVCNGSTLPSSTFGPLPCLYPQLQGVRPSSITSASLAPSVPSSTAPSLSGAPASASPSSPPSSSPSSSATISSQTLAVSTQSGPLTIPISTYPFYLFI